MAPPSALPIAVVIVLLSVDLSFLSPRLRRSFDSSDFAFGYVEYLCNSANFCWLSIFFKAFVLSCFDEAIPFAAVGASLVLVLDCMFAVLVLLILGTAAFAPEGSDFCCFVSACVLLNVAVDPRARREAEVFAIVADYCLATVG